MVKILNFLKQLYHIYILYIMHLYLGSPQSPSIDNCTTAPSMTQPNRATPPNTGQFAPQVWYGTI